MLGGVGANINADLGHHLDCHRVHRAGGVGSRTGHDGGVAERGAQDAFGEMAAAAVAGAED